MLRGRNVRWIPAVAAACMVLGMGVRARAQSRGDIILTQVPIPADIEGRKLSTFLRKNRVRVLKSDEGAKSYTFWVTARLSRQPSKSLLNLPQNGGKIHLVVYVKEKRRWTYVNVLDVNYVPAKIIMFKAQIPEDFGLSTGKQYQMRLTVLNARNKEIVLARTNFKVK